MVVIISVVYLFRWMRQREIDAFLEADMKAFHTFKVSQKESEAPDPILARAETYAALNPGAVKPVRLESEEASDPLLLSSPDPTLHFLREQTFDEVTRNLLLQLLQIVPPDVVVLRDVPLSEFVRVAEGGDYKLTSYRVAFLLCTADTLSVICGLQLKEPVSALSGADFVKGVFNDIGRPLLELPVSNDVSAVELNDMLMPVLLGREQQSCPRCGQEMTIRKARKGKSAGSVFWVCAQFPGCRGVVKI